MVRNEWTLKIKEFGKIKETSITVSPFMMFVGHNNSGKSYIMELLWGLMMKAEQLSSLSQPEVIAKIQQKIEPMKGMDQYEVTIDEEVQKTFINEWNRILNERKKELIQSIFRHDINIDMLEIERETYLPITISWELKEEIPDQTSNDKILRYIISVDGKQYHSLGGHLKQGSWENPEGKHMKDLLMSEAIKTLFLMQFHYGYLGKQRNFNPNTNQPLYFPASRTGFMQTYKAIVGNLLTNKEELFITDQPAERPEIIEGTTLTWPTQNYLTRLVKLTSSEEYEEKYKDLLQFMEIHLMKGSVQKTDLGQFEFISDQDKRLPLHITSSLIAELAPLYLFLTSSKQSDLWLIEEIESHLHPNIQLEVARLLMRLTHAGFNIWMTTHSDNIVNVVNNMLVLAQKENRTELLQKLGWELQDLPIRVSDIKLYQFDNSLTETTITELPLGANGFEVESFNDALDKLIENTVTIQNDGV
ncbi:MULTISPECIES: AAA family ATPase [unclassified Sporosarcina]|uniref:AAA family ATPase n=1 Tax=unclassified Sporosarcina TaxID=2647733 RepID=UPI00203C9AA9|nr:MULTISPECIES: AAA family ATPase [unclassified Sporosarcina]GKV65203.1 hypothetical protein NCCP2331_13560 [Sporosarcina sp. NCCP-2331]GLB55327.1 hypothetical protein NCCP2378_11130 [Sporosarcina sp. NCCP-2378]